MVEFKEEVKTITQKIAEKIICDKCGEEVKLADYSSEGYIHNFNIDWGFGSNHDCERWEFDLCEKCILEMLEGINVRTYD